MSPVVVVSFIKDGKENKVVINSAEQLLEFVEKLASGLSDAIEEFFIRKEDVNEDDINKFEPFEEPEYDTDAGIDNEYYDDDGEPI